VTEDTISGYVPHGIFKSEQKEVALGNCSKPLVKSSHLRLLARR